MQNTPFVNRNAKPFGSFATNAASARSVIGAKLRGEHRPFSNNKTTDAIANGTSEGARKGWVTRRAGGNVNGIGTSDDDNDRTIDGSPAHRKFMEEGDAKGFNAKELKKYRPADSARYELGQADKAEKLGKMDEAKERRARAEKHFNEAALSDPTNADVYKQQARGETPRAMAPPAQKTAADLDAEAAARVRTPGFGKMIARRRAAAPAWHAKHENSAPPTDAVANGTSDALPNGEFKLFENGHGATAEKKCDCKEGESCDKCKSDKKEWTPPWKKDGVENAGNSEGAKKGWLTRNGGIRADEHFQKDDGSHHVKLTVQGSGDDQKDVQLELPKGTHDAVMAGTFKPSAELEKHSKGEDFHVIHGYEPVERLRAQYGKGSEADKYNGLIGGALGRAKAYYSRSREYPDGSQASHALKARAEQLLSDIHSKHVPAREAAKKMGAAAGVANSRYMRAVNRIRTGVILNYSSSVRDMLDEVEEYSESGEALPDDLREQYEEWLEDGGSEW